MKNQFIFESEPFEFSWEIEDEKPDFFSAIPQRRYSNRFEHSPFYKRHKRRFKKGLSPQENYEIYQPESSDKAIQGFMGSEHRDIGDLALGKIPTSIVYTESGKRLTFGEMIALAGDYFGTYFEMNELSKSQVGRAKISWALWRALDLPKNLEPKVSTDIKKAAEIKKAVVERYHVLASENVSHFSAGGTAWSTYLKWHSEAMVDAIDAGLHSDGKLWQRAISKEGFACHFLTDMFSAGHVRTPRLEMRSWYMQYFRDSIDRIIRYMADFIYKQLDKKNALPTKAKIFPGKARNKIANDIKALGGAAIQTFSLGDIVSLALHNFDNEGLYVVSEADVNGKHIKGGFLWKAVGDSHLKSERSKNPELDKITTKMVVKAVKSSFQELVKIRQAGKNASAPSNINKMALIKRILGNPLTFAAKGFIPRVDLNSKYNTPMSGGTITLEWRWGKLGNYAYDQVDKTVKESIAEQLKEKAGDVKDPKTRDAFNEFIKILEKHGIKVLEAAIGKKAR
jgi:hypothetical protein